jgi:hypothetical protein
VGTTRYSIFSLVALSALALGAEPESAEGLLYWIRPDRVEAVVVNVAKEETSYFNNDSSRYCYTFTVSGRWRPLRHSMSFLESGDAKSRVGVLLYSPRELARFPGSTPIDRALSLITRSYEVQFGAPPPVARVEEFPTAGPKAVRWSIEWSMPLKGQVERATAQKVVVEAAPGWVAQVSYGGPLVDDTVVRKVLEAIRTTTNPDCYRTSIPARPAHVR